MLCSLLFFCGKSSRESSQANVLFKVDVMRSDHRLRDASLKIRVTQRLYQDSNRFVQLRERNSISSKVKVQNMNNQSKSSKVDVDQLQKTVRNVDQPKKQIYPMFALGERNSGTHMLTKGLKECYGENIVSNTFARDKHWLQDEYVFTSRRENVKKRSIDAYESKKYTIFIIVRNVYNWVAAMTAKPYEMPAHAKLRENMTKFILHPWAMDNPPTDTQKRDCQGNFPTFRYVMPCMDYRGLYELNSTTGQPYRNILDFRAARIQNWLNMTSWNPKVVILQLESYYNNPREFLAKIEKAVGAKCTNTQLFDIDFKKEKIVRMAKLTDYFFHYESKKASNENYKISPFNIELIRQLTNWEWEKKIGYTDKNFESGRK
eukprot:g4380.t1